MRRRNGAAVVQAFVPTSDASIPLAMPLVFGSAKLSAEVRERLGHPPSYFCVGAIDALGTLGSHTGRPKRSAKGAKPTFLVPRSTHR